MDEAIIADLKYSNGIAIVPVSLIRLKLLALISVQTNLGDLLRFSDEVTKTVVLKNWVESLKIC